MSHFRNNATSPRRNTTRSSSSTSSYDADQSDFPFSSTNGPQFDPATYPPSTTLVIISNFDSNKSPRLIIKFLLNRIRTRNAKIDIIDAWKVEDNVMILVPSPNQAAEFNHFDMIKFDDRQIRIRTESPTNVRLNFTTPTQSQVGNPNDPVLKMLQSRYTHTTESLDLSNISKDPSIISTKLSSNAWIKLRDTMASLLITHNVQVRSVNLSRNNLCNLRPWGDFLKSIPTLKELDISYNQITQTTGLDPITSSTHPDLQVLNTRNNPFHQPSGNKNRDEFITRMRDRFPKLNVLDGDPIVVLAVCSHLSLQELLPKVLGNAVHSVELHGMPLFPFIASFCSAFDTDRDLLLKVYHADATFSVCGEWTNFSRNLLQVKSADIAFERLYYGPQEIVHKLKEMPTTTHDMDSMVLDAWINPILGPGGAEGSNPLITVFMHGLLTDQIKSYKHKSQVSSGKLAYDRTLCMLATAGGTSPFVIVNDQLNLRRVPAFKQKSFTFPWTEAITAKPPTNEIVPPRPAGMQDNEYNLVVQAMHQFGLHFDGAVHCLTVTNGDLQAIASAKIAGQIPADLFRQN